MNYQRFCITPDDMLGASLEPTTLLIETTTRCNGTCSYCAMSIERPTPMDMDIDTYRYIVDSVPSAKVVWPVSFGEALLWPHLVDAVAYASQAGKSVNLTTNGILLDRTMAWNLLQVGLNRIQFSVDAADARTYAKLRPGLDFSALVRNVTAFRQERSKLGAGCRMVARVTVTGDNQAQREHIGDFWRKLGCTVQFKPALWVPSPNDNGYTSSKPRPCRWPVRTLAVKVDGRVVLCCKDWWASYAVGSIHDSLPMDVYRGDAFRAMREGMATGQRVPIICRCCAEVLE